MKTWRDFLAFLDRHEVYTYGGDDESISIDGTVYREHFDAWMCPAWITTTPTVPGWYWFRGKYGQLGYWGDKPVDWHMKDVGPLVLQLSWNGREVQLESGYWCGYDCEWPDLDELHGEWAGPLTPPEAQQDGLER